MILVLLFVVSVLSAAAGAVLGIAPLTVGGLAGAGLLGFWILWQLAARRPSADIDALPRDCPNPGCRQRVPAESAFCPRCGRRMAGAGARPVSD